MCPPGRRCPRRSYGRPRSLARAQRQGDMAVYRILVLFAPLVRRLRFWERRMERRQRDVVMHAANVTWHTYVVEV